MEQPFTIALVAGEASGDLHGANLMHAIKRQDQEAEFRAWGGDRMASEGAELVHHVRDLAFMGFWEVAINLRRILGLLSEARKDMLDWKPDAVILVDYPGFNLRLAATANEAGLTVLWYISPQVWAWKAGRVHKLKERVDRLYAILPFEKDFYAEYGMEIVYIGHPLLDELGKRAADSGAKALKNAAGEPVPSKPWIAMLPGSRKQELNRLLPVMLQVARNFPDRSFALAGLTQLGEAHYRSYQLPQNVQLFLDQTYQILEQSSAAMVTSGTATLETALIGVPEVVLYRGSPLSFWIARRLVKVPFISLVNLVLNRALVTELLQSQVNSEQVTRELTSLIEDSQRRSDIQSGYLELRELLGGEGASDRAATDMVDFIRSRMQAGA